MRRSSIKMFASHDVINDIRYIVMSIIVVLLVSGIFEHTAYGQANMENTQSKVSIKDGDEWYYFKGIQKPPREWNTTGFDQNSWQKGPSGLGYGTGSNRTDLADMKGNYLTVYARRGFDISNPEKIRSMNLSIVCDGPFIAYINGIEAIRTNTIQNSQTVDLFGAEQFDISGLAHELFPMGNIISVECSNDDINSEDFSLIPAFEVFEIKEVK